MSRRAGVFKRIGHPVIGGGISGILTAIVFALVHQWLISDIWFSLVPMMVAGAICGASLAWTYDVLFPSATLASWSAYVGLHLALLLALGVISIAVFEPVVPMAVVVLANEPPTDLIRQALPLTLAFVLIAAGVVSALWGRSWRRFGASLVTSSVLIAFFGLNVSVIGLVEMSSDSVYPLVEFLWLTGMILVLYGAGYYALVRSTVFASTHDR